MAPERLAPMRRASLKIGVGKIRAGQIGIGQRGEPQRGVPEPRLGEVDRPAIDWADLPLGHAQRDANQVWRDVRILRTPKIPRSGARAHTRHDEILTTPRNLRYRTTQRMQRMLRATNRTQRHCKLSPSKRGVTPATIRELEFACRVLFPRARRGSASTLTPKAEEPPRGGLCTIRS